jgi:hypothetical protein
MTLIETTTSVYQIQKEGRLFFVTKVALKEGAGSRISPGQTFRGDKIIINENGLTLFLEGQPVMKTSPLIL